MADHQCPRRSENTGPWAYPEGDTWRPDGTCSYCGSITPAAFFAAAEAGHKITPTDKSYKVYVDLPEENPEELRVVSSTCRDDRPEGDGWIEATPEVCEKYGWTPWGEGRMWITVAAKGPTRHTKFYFQHLSAEDRTRFIDLANGGKFNLAYPGHFYVTPFFCQKITPPPADGVCAP